MLWVVLPRIVIFHRSNCDDTPTAINCVSFNWKKKPKRYALDLHFESEIHLYCIVMVARIVSLKWRTSAYKVVLINTILIDHVSHEYLQRVRMHTSSYPPPFLTKAETIWSITSLCAGRIRINAAFLLLILIVAPKSNGSCSLPSTPISSWVSNDATGLLVSHSVSVRETELEYRPGLYVLVYEVIVSFV